MPEVAAMKKLGETVKGDRVVVFRRGLPESGTVWLVKKDGTRVVKLDDYSPVKRRFPLPLLPDPPRMNREGLEEMVRELERLAANPPFEIVCLAPGQEPPDGCVVLTDGEGRKSPRPRRTRGRR